MRCWLDFINYCEANAGHKGVIALNNNWIIHISDDRQTISVCNNGETWLRIERWYEVSVKYGCPTEFIRLYQDDESDPVAKAMWFNTINIRDDVIYNDHYIEAFIVIMDIMEETEKHEQNFR